ncbi:MAG: NYN domain-containing protein [Potamolinea sp.]
MTDIRLASVGIYWDLQNVSLNQKQANCLLDFANFKGHLIHKKVYYNSLCQDQASAKDKLESLGFYCVDVPCPLKNSADNQLKSDVLDDISNNLPPDTVILVSGDGDFANPVGILQKLGKKVIIIAQRGNVKQKLKELADEFYFVDELFKLVEDKAEPKIASIQSKMTYEDAIDCLLEAIKTALSKGKCTALGYINKLMRSSQRFPNYQGVSSILKPDGKTFLKFSKFVDAVVKEGKIRRQKEEVFLVEVEQLAT